MQTSGMMNRDLITSLILNQNRPAFRIGQRFLISPASLPADLSSCMYVSTLRLSPAFFFFFFFISLLAYRLSGYGEVLSTECVNRR
ncbi:hypothetical protein BDZ91DRAFT_380537 [Kalaharituber pfeilii]|nr:hypothetical protein BDZ91DRAFT_380537 [Kalaharituber pfeilii]